MVMKLVDKIGKPDKQSFFRIYVQRKCIYKKLISLKLHHLGLHKSLVKALHRPGVYHRASEVVTLPLTHSQLFFFLQPTGIGTTIPRWQRTCKAQRTA